MRRITALLAPLALVLTLVPAAASAAPSATSTWIVTLRDGVEAAGAGPALARQHGGRVGFVYEHAINGFSFRGSQAAASALLRSPTVLSVEADAEVWLDTTQSPATWGLDRIDQRTLPLSNSYTYSPTGAGVTAYVIDSGIRTAHNEFGGRARVGADFIGDGQNGQDCNGHGTHVAGTIGGATYGVAKAVELVSVRVFGCSGGSTWEVIIAGIDWVIADHAPGEPAVANMSLGGSGTSSIDTATNNLINDGVATAVAAGNGNFIGRQANACNYSPARVPNAMTISATTSSDAKASWANYGDCVDWFAPGVSITSAWYSSNTATNTISGTSMATPHTAGVAALYLDLDPGASPSTVRDAIFANTTKDIVTSSSTANNDLLYMGFLNGGEPPPDPNTAPIADDVWTSGDENTTIAWTPSASDADGDSLTCSIAAQSTSGGTATVASDCTAGSYTPVADFTGPATFTYEVSDGQASDTGTVTITVNDVTEPPSSDTFGLTLAGSATGQGSSWTSTVTVSAASGSTPLAGVTISGSWSNGGTETCTTGSDGTCTASRSQHKRVGSVTFTVTSATHATLTWDGGPDSVTIAKS